MNLKLIQVIIFLSISSACVPIINDDQSNTTQVIKKIFTTQNHNYEPQVKTVELRRSDSPDKTAPPIISLGSNTTLQLDFDMLGEDQESLFAKVIHCNANWKPSILNEIEYLNDFNEFPLRDFQFSSATKVPYIHYRFTLPRLKVSGNYVLVVYRDSNLEDLILTHRFIIYDNKVTIKAKPEASIQPSERERNQQIAFDISLNNYQILNPQGELKVVLRQNYRWNYLNDTLQATAVRDFEKKVEYRPVDLSNNFKGGNEFRQFSCESQRFLGFNVAEISRKNDTTVFTLLEDITRDKQSYLRRPDRNGQYIIRHHESQRGITESDYVKVNFRLKRQALVGSKLYVIGAFNDWQISPENEMKYQQAQGHYEANILLKQGLYDYLYAVLDSKGNFIVAPLEGTHQATENAYDILVYHRPPGARADQVIGYRRFNTQE